MNPSEQPAHKQLEDTVMELASIEASKQAADRVALRVLAGDTKVYAGERSSQSRNVQIAVGMSVAAVMVAIVLAGLVLNEGPRRLMAGMQDRVQQTQTVQFVEVLGDVEVRRELAELKNMVHMIQTEMKATGVETEPAHVARVRKQIASLEGSLNRNEPVVARRVWIQGRYLQRSEKMRGGPKVINIINAKTGKNVTLHPDEKRCVLMKTQTVLDMKTGKKKTHDLGPNPASDFYSGIRSIPTEKVSVLQKVNLEGRTVERFEQVESSQGMEFKTTYWIDARSMLPLQIEHTVQRDGKVIGSSTMTEFVFDKKLDPKLFDTTPPKGYEVSTGGFMSLDAGEPKH